MLLTKPTLKKICEHLKKNKVLNPKQPKEKIKPPPPKKITLKINVLKRLPASDIVKTLYILKEKKEDFIIN
jgi:hypothetical protein